ncbi:MAG: type II toxin-antitoxin system RelE/ParE family toxin [Gammaproteobacteria bacterium]
MAEIPVRLHPLAADEADSARLHYRAHSARVAEAFVAELDATVAAIADGARRWPRLYVRFRRYPMRRFPFSVVYVERANCVEITAIAHHRRRPGRRA